MASPPPHAAHEDGWPQWRRDEARRVSLNPRRRLGARRRRYGVEAEAIVVGVDIVGAAWREEIAQHDLGEALAFAREDASEAFGVRAWVGEHAAEGFEAAG
jgi:hypothetical protein